MIVDGTNISMFRGDSESLTITLYDDLGNNVDFIAGDTVYFTVKESMQTNVKTLQKIVKEFRNGKASRRGARRSGEIRKGLRVLCERGAWNSSKSKSIVFALSVCGGQLSALGSDF